MLKATIKILFTSPRGRIIKEKKISQVESKNYPGQSQDGLLFTAGMSEA